VDPQFDKADWKFNVLCSAFCVRSELWVRRWRWTKNS